jgi:hypothetical protein
MMQRLIAAGHPERTVPAAECAPSRAVIPVAPALAVLLVVIVLWLAAGVSVADIALFLGYQLAYVLAPGWLVYRAASPDPGGALRQVVFGWTLGYVVEILFFIATAAAGIRPWLAAYPLLIGLLAGPLAWRRGVGRGSPPLWRGSGWAWCVALACALALVYIGVAYMSQMPLPGSVDRVVYFVDTVWDVSVAGEALHHWPVTNPSVEGESLNYHNFVFYHFAAVSQITGLGLPAVVFHLSILPMVVLLVLAIVHAAGVITRIHWLGLVVVALVLFIGELDFNRGNDVRFGGTVFSYVYGSPTFLLGLLVFIPTVVLLYELSAARTAAEWARRNGVVLTLLLVGCAGAKASILPVLAGGLGIVLLWQLLSRRLHAPAVAAFAAVAAVSGVAYLLIYGGSGEASGTKGGVAPFGAFAQMVEIQELRPHLPDALHFQPLVRILETGVGMAGMMGASVIGLVAFALLRRRPWPDRDVLLIGFVATAFGLFSFLGYPLNTAISFLLYGAAVAAFLAAQGLHLLWARWRGPGAAGRSRQWLLAPIGLAAAFLAMGALDTPIDSWDAVNSWRRGHAFHAEAAPGRRGVTPGLFRGLDWIRENTPSDAVLIVNNTDPTFSAYSAFAERRVLLEGWAYSSRVEGDPDTSQPYPGRFRFSQAVATEADRDAVMMLAKRHSNAYVVQDRVNVPDPRPLPRPASLVYSNPDIAVYALGDRASSGRRARSPAGRRLIGAGMSSFSTSSDLPRGMDAPPPPPHR